MSVIAVLILLILAAAAFGAWMLFWGVRRKFRQRFPNKEARSKTYLLHTGLKTAGFFEPLSASTDLLYMENAYLSRLAQELAVDDYLFDYVKQHGLRLVNNTRTQIPFPWLLCSSSHCLGVELR